MTTRHRDTLVGEVLPADVVERLRAELEAALRAHEARLAEPPAVDDDVEVAMYNRAEVARADVAATLSRIEDGTYGLCESCGQPIPLERLEALPHAAYCAGCAGRNQPVLQR